MKRYERAMRKAKYQAFWIRVRFWFGEYAVDLIFIPILLLLLLYGVMGIL